MRRSKSAWWLPVLCLGAWSLRGPLGAAAQTPNGLSGQIRYYSNGLPVSGVTVQLIGPTPGAAQTDANGNYAFTNLVPGNWRVEPLKTGGFANGVSVLDAAYILQALAGLRTLSSQALLACDVSGNGTPSVLDAAYILQILSGVIGKFPVAQACGGSDWIFLPVPSPVPGQQIIQPQTTPTPCQPGAIAYQPLAGQADHQDFQALLFGDCTGNWSGTGTAVPTLTPTSTPSRTPTVPPSPTNTATGGPWPQLSLTAVATGLNQPLHITSARDGSGRLFVVEQSGHIRFIKNNVLQPADFLDIHSRVSCCGERGLLSVAFPPGYAGKRYFYVDYTDVSGNTVVARYRLTANDDVADPNSEQILLGVTQPFANHNGGQLAFGPDGYLYIGMGDGGSGGDPQNNGQNTSTLLGKLLRIDVESVVTPTTTPTPYAIPATNPTPNQTPGYRREIWALGLRNPWRFSFDRLTGDLYIGDVGQNLYEEVDVQPASSPGGENYGWRIMEGFHCFNPNPCDATGLTLPVVEYGHTSGNCSITGGFVYRGSSFPCMQGVYFYADYCTGIIWGLKRNGAAWQSMQLYDAPFSITTFGEDEAGELYVSDYNNGAIYKLTDACS